MHPDKAFSNDNKDRDPFNFNPADGEYTFRIGKLKETDVKRSSKGTPMVKVPLIGTESLPFQMINENGEVINLKGPVYVKTTMYVTPKSVGRALDLLEHATGNRPTPGAIKDEFTLADAVQAAQGKFVKATIKKGEPREWNGKTYTDYEVGGFKAPF